MTRRFLSCVKFKRLFPFALLYLLTSMQAALQAQNCNPDVTPPVSVCNSLTFVSLDNNGLAVLDASPFESGSYDDCCLASIKVKRQTDGPCDADNLPDDFDSTVVLCCSDIGANLTLVLRAYDCSGNTSECLATVKVEDKVGPVCLAPADVTVSCETFDASLNTYGNMNATDNCCIDTIIKTVNYAAFSQGCNSGTIIRTFKAYDCNFNSSQCSQRIVVNYEQDFYIRFPDDLIMTTAGNGNYGEPVFFGDDCETLSFVYNDVVYTNLPEADIKIERTWDIVSWCTFDPLQDFIVVPNPNPADPFNDPANFPGPIVSAPGTPAPWAPTVADLTPQGPLVDFSTYYSTTASGYSYKQIIWIDLPDPATVTGKVFSDTLNNCGYDNGEALLEGWRVKITGMVSGAVYETLTDSLGEYSRDIDPVDTLVEVSLAAAYNYGQNCSSVYEVATASGQETVQDIPVKLEVNCPILSIDVSAPFLRRCFANTYTVQACNLSAETVENVYTEVTLDSWLDFSSSSIPGTSLGNNTWSFDLGNLAPGECTSFLIDFHVDCDAPLGYTHCTEAHIFPDTVCNTSNNWSGADLKVSGVCDGDSVRLTITNIGAGPMSESQDFVVVEDVVMYFTAPFQLGAGASTSYTFPANGATWRMETDEVANHPWGGVEAKAVEGCGGFNTPGLVTMFSFNTPDPFETVDCQENIGAYDPNDKQAFPKGFGSQHFLKANTEIEYRIRFQNTGTDTAFTVVVLDTLAEHLDAASVRPGASSHAYDFAVLDGNVLRFRFDNILLPDSNVNQAASNGFVTFNVAQKPDNAIGTLIENRAAIYFDFNEPVLTNTTFHTIGDHFVLVSTDNTTTTAPLQVYPNPSSGSVFFEIPDATSNNRFVLSDSQGKTVLSAAFSGKTYRFEKGALPAGVYFFKVTTGNGGSFTGKVVLK